MLRRLLQQNHLREATGRLYPESIVYQLRQTQIYNSCLGPGLSVQPELSCRKCRAVIPTYLMHVHSPRLLFRGLRRFAHCVKSNEEIFALLWDDLVLLMLGRRRAVWWSHRATLFYVHLLYFLAVGSCPNCYDDETRVMGLEYC